MEFTEPKSMQSDYLQTTRFLCSSIYKTKLGKFILLLILAIHGSFSIGFIYFSFIVERDFSIFVSQASLSLGPLWVFLEATVILSKVDLVEKLPQELRLWSADSVGEEIDRKIKKEAKIVKLFTIAIYSSGVFTSLLYVKSSPTDSKYFFAFYFFDKYVPEHSILFGFLFRSTFPFLAYVALTHALQFIYYTQHLKYQATVVCVDHGKSVESTTQATMFHKHVECLAEYGTSEENNLRMYYDNEFQKEISRRLNFLIKRHNEFKDLWLLKKEEMEHLIGLFSLGGCLVGIGFATWFIMFYEQILFSCLSVLRVIFLCGCSLITFCVTIFYGQILEDVSLERTTLTSEWYLFDNFNKNKLLIFMINEDKPIKIQFLNNSVNFELGLKIVKGIYAVASVLFKTKIHH